jgi:hypothetical protein
MSEELRATLAEVAELLVRAEAADQVDVADGMSIPEELARREERLASDQGLERGARAQEDARGLTARPNRDKSY